MPKPEPTLSPTVVYAALNNEGGTTGVSILKTIAKHHRVRQKWSILAATADLQNQIESVVGTPPKSKAQVIDYACRQTTIDFAMRLLSARRGARTFSMDIDAEKLKEYGISAIELITGLQERNRGTELGLTHNGSEAQISVRSAGEWAKFFKA